MLQNNEIGPIEEESRVARKRRMTLGDQTASLYRYAVQLQRYRRTETLELRLKRRASPGRLTSEASLHYLIKKAPPNAVKVRLNLQG